MGFGVSGLQHLERIFLLGAAWEVGALTGARGLPSAQHVFHPGGHGLGFSSPKSPLWGFLH